MCIRDRASADLTREQPALVHALGALEGSIDAQRMRTANLAVDREGLSPAEVASALLGDTPPR